jgi:ankyrin repeat protein
MECLFDKNKPRFAAWLRLHNIDDSSCDSKTTVDFARPHPVPLYYAVLFGSRDIVKRLIAHPQDVNARGGERMSPLVHAAVEKGHLSVAMLLVDRGADMESRDSQSRTLQHIAMDMLRTSHCLSIAVWIQMPKMSTGRLHCILRRRGATTIPSGYYPVTAQSRIVGYIVAGLRRMPPRREATTTWHRPVITRLRRGRGSPGRVRPESTVSRFAER